jgi:hypothetical protein
LKLLLEALGLIGLLQRHWRNNLLRGWPTICTNKLINSKKKN